MVVVSLRKGQAMAMAGVAISVFGLTVLLFATRIATSYFPLHPLEILGVAVAGVGVLVALMGARTA